MTPTQIGLIVIAVLVALLAGSGYMLKRQIAENGRLESQIAVQQASLDKITEEKAKADAALVERDRLLSKRSGEVQTLRTRLRALERENAVVQEWMRQPLPQPVVEFLCKLTHSDSPVCVPPTGPAPAAPVGAVDGDHERRPARLGRADGGADGRAQCGQAGCQPVLQGG